MKKIIRVVAAVVERDAHYLITQRRAEAVLPGLWEFPGGRVEAGESDEQALARELGERLGARVLLGRKIGGRHHAYAGYEVALALYQAKLPDGERLRALRVQDFRWVTSDQFAQYQFPDADQATMDLLLGVGQGA